MTTSPRPLMVFEQLHCRHGERLLFDIPRLALSAGNAVVITGANGVGKTTLLRMLAGLVPAAEACVDFGRGPQPLSSTRPRCGRGSPMCTSIRTCSAPRCGTTLPTG